MHFSPLLLVLLQRSHIGFVVWGEAAGGDMLSGGEAWSEPLLTPGGVTCEPAGEPGAHSPASPHDGELCPSHTPFPTQGWLTVPATPPAGTHSPRLRYRPET